MSAAEAGEQLKPWIEASMPDLAAWLPLLAIPFGATVPSTPEVDRLDRSFIHERLHEAVAQFLQRVLMMPSLIVIEDVHWLDDASSFLLQHLTRAQAPAPWLFVMTRRPEGPSFVSTAFGDLVELEPLADDDANQLALVAAGDVPPERTGSRGRRRARGRQPVVRARAHRGGEERRRARHAAADGRDADDGSDRHARSRRPAAAALRIGARAVLRARSARRRARGATSRTTTAGSGCRSSSPGMGRHASRSTTICSGRLRTRACRCGDAPSCTDALR